MSNSLHKKNKKQKKQWKYDSWFMVIWFSFLECITYIPGNSIGTDGISWVDANEHLGILGKKRKEKLIMIVGIIIGSLIIGMDYFLEKSINLACLIIGIVLSIFSIIGWLICRTK